VIWNGVSVTGPVLVFQDEIAVYSTVPEFSSLDDPGSGALLCRSETRATAGWHLTDGSFINMHSSPAFHQRTTVAGAIPSEAALVRYTDRTVSTDNHNGLWTCRLNDASETPASVGVYQRGGEHIVSIISLAL
jgi:hypothetical protein